MPGAGERPPERGQAELGVTELRLAGSLGRREKLGLGGDRGVEGMGVGAGQGAEWWWEDVGQEAPGRLPSSQPRHPLRVGY